MKLIFIIFLSLFLTSCKENFHLTSITIAVQSHPDSSASNNNTVGDKGQVYVGDTKTIQGICSPDNAIVSLSSAILSEPVNCPCQAGSFSCENVTFLGSIGHNNINLTIIDANNNRSNSTMLIEILPPTLTVNLFGPIDPGTSHTLSGTCFPSGSDINLSHASMTPNNVNCSCLDNLYSCPSVTFDGSESHLHLAATATDSSGNISTNTFPINNAITPISALLNTGISINPSPHPQNLSSSMGSCFPIGATVSLSATPLSSMNPSTVSCNCNANSEIDCSGASAIINSSDFTLTPTITDGTSTITGSPEEIHIPGHLTLNTISSPVEIGETVNIAGTCSVPGSEVNISIPSQFSTTPISSNIYCNCPSDGTFDVLSSDCDNTPGEGGVTITAVTASNSGSAIFSGLLTDPDGDTDGPKTQSLTVTAPSLDITGPTSLTPSASAQALPNNMGTCNPDGTSTISVSASPTTSMVPSTVSCDCNSGVVDCSMNHVIVNGSDFNLTSSLSVGGHVYNDPTNQFVTVLTTLTMNALAASYDVFDNIPISGTCGAPGSEVTITLPSQIVSTPSSHTLYCECQTDNTYNVANGDCDDTSGPGGTTITATRANTPSSSLSLSANISDTDGESSGPVTRNTQIHTPSLDLNSPSSILASSSSQTLPSNMGTCSPNSTGTISVTATPSTSMIPSTIACNCSSGQIDCSTNNVIINSLDFNLSSTISDGDGGTYADPTPQSIDVPAALTLNSYPLGFDVGDTVPIEGSCAVPGSEISITLPSELVSNPITSSLYCNCPSDGTFKVADGDCDNTSGAGGSTISGVSANSPGTAVTIQATITDGDGDSIGPIHQNLNIDGFNCNSLLTAFGFFEEGIALPSTSIAPPAGSIVIPIHASSNRTVTFTINQNGFKAGTASGSGTYSTSIAAGDTQVAVPMSYDGSLAPIGVGMEGWVDLSITSSDYAGSCPARAKVLKPPVQLVGVAAGIYSEDGTEGVCMKAQSDTVYCWGKTSTFHGKSPATAGLKHNMSADFAALSPVDTPFQILSTESNGYALTDSGKLVSWGQYKNANKSAIGRDLGNTGGATIFGAVNYVSQPALEGWDFSGRVVNNLSSDHTEGCATLDNGELWCWGVKSRDVGLGVALGTTESRTPVQAQVDNGLGGSQPVTNAAYVWVGGNVACFKTFTGDLYCAGENKYGEVGNAAGGTDTSVFKKITLPDAVELVAYNGKMTINSTCALLINGQVWCWGRYLNAGVNTHIPQQIVSAETGTPPLTNMSMLVSGINHVCALKNRDLATATTSVYCWGSNSKGQLGNSTWAEAQYQAKAVSGLPERALWVDIGQEYSCALVTDSANNWTNVYCWGSQSHGRLGNNATSGSTSTPQLFGNIGSGPFPAFQNSLNILDHIVVFRHDTCVISEIGEAYCAGEHSGNNPRTMIVDFLNE